SLQFSKTTSAGRPKLELLYINFIGNTMLWSSALFTDQGISNPQSIPFTGLPPGYRIEESSECAGVMNWKEHGIKIVRAGDLDANTPQTAGMTRAAAITHARTGASKLWAGTVTIHPHAKTGAHHHGDLESVIYVVYGRARMRWGDHLEYVAEAGPGDFIFVPPF